MVNSGDFNVGKTMENKASMTGNGSHTPYENGDDWGMVYFCFNHIISNNIK